jgi:Methyltransferase domain
VTIYSSAYETCPEVCGNLERPGVALDMPLWIEHAHLDTTVDQLRIEDALTRMEWRGKSFLHVGVGNSRFAQRFAADAALIDGLTVSRVEVELAQALHIPNYAVYLLNKYGREFLLTITNSYDFVIDNNMASYACCKYHFYRMLDNYLRVMKPGGQILTDQRGMDFTVEDKRWIFTFEDLQSLERKFPIRAARINDTVFALVSESAP